MKRSSKTAKKVLNPEANNFTIPQVIKLKQPKKPIIHLTEECKDYEHWLKQQTSLNQRFEVEINQVIEKISRANSRLTTSLRKLKTNHKLLEELKSDKLGKQRGLLERKEKSLVHVLYKCPTAINRG